MSEHALPNDNDRPANQSEDLIARFKRQHREAMTEVQIAAAHTATEGWQRLYSTHRDEERKARREMAKNLRRHATQLEDVGLTEDEEKLVKAIVKASEDNRDRYLNFENEVVEKVIAPVRAVERLLTEAKHAAARDEAAAPLVNVGLEHLMREAIEAVPTVTFSREQGTITITMPDKKRK